MLSFVFVCVWSGHNHGNNLIKCSRLPRSNFLIGKMADRKSGNMGEQDRENLVQHTSSFFVCVKLCKCVKDFIFVEVLFLIGYDFCPIMKIH